MRIQKNTIMIRSAVLDDARQLQGWWNDGKVMEHAGFPNGLGISLEDTRDTIRRWEGKLGQLCIIEIDGKPVGELSYRVSKHTVYPGWKICDPDYQNHGYGTELIKMLFSFLFADEAIQNIVWDTSMDNQRAQYVYENKLRARKLGLRENAWQDQLGTWRHAVDYEMTREQWLSETVSFQ